MLKLTRKINQAIRIGDKVTIHVLRISGNQVRLGIDAPRDMPIVRDDVRTRPDPALSKKIVDDSMQECWIE